MISLCNVGRVCRDGSLFLTGAVALMVLSACQPAPTVSGQSAGGASTVRHSDAAAGGAGGSEGVSQAESGLDRVPLSIETASGQHRFTVEIARSTAEQAQGLMGRPPLAADAGMIFPMRPWRPASFWMKNTPSSLDIIFIAPGGRVLRVAERTTPLSLAPIESGGVVEAVLEIAAGRAQEIGLRPGDRIIWRDPAL